MIKSKIWEEEQTGFTKPRIVSLSCTSRLLWLRKSQIEIPACNWNMGLGQERAVWAGNLKKEEILHQQYTEGS